MHDSEVMMQPNGPTNALIDLGHLAIQTDNDAVLMREILVMFVDQARETARGLDDCLAAKMEAAEQARHISALLHRSRGTALAVGAFATAAEIASLEAKIDVGGSLRGLETELEPLQRSLAAAAVEATSLIAAQP